jgi:hypothetical protein
MSNHDDLTGTLTRELQEHAHAMDGTHLHLADVTGRARSIRRRRTATAVAGVAAAVAVIIPTAALATHTGGKAEPAPAVSLTPSPTQTANGDGHQPAPGVLDVSNLPTGDTPRTEYVTDGKVLHQSDGTTVDIGTHDSVTHFVVMSDGSRVWETADDVGNPSVEVQKADGTILAPERSQWGLAVNPKHTIAAWVTPDGQVRTWSDGTTEAADFGDPITAGHELRIADVTGDDCDLVCSVVVNVADAQTDSGWQPWEVSLNGTQELTDGSYLTVNDISEAGLTIGYRKITDFGTCSTLLGGGEFQGFTTCRHTLASFSPDGNLILADPAYHDGIGNGVIGMYDLEGELWDRHSTAKAQSFYNGAEWEDDTHVLAPVFQDRTWSLVRFASDGTMEYAVPPTPGKDMNNPYVIPTGGMPPTGS